MAKETKSKIKKSTKKSFFEVEAPLISTKIHLYSASKEELEGKTIRIDLTKNLRGKNMELCLRIKKDGENLRGEPESIKLIGSYVRRAVRKGTDYSEDSFETECRDARVRIKPLMVTRKRVSKTILKVLREQARNWLETYLKTRTGQELVSEIISNKIQKQLAAKLKKVYPLALCEIRMFEILGKVKSAESGTNNSVE